MMIMNVVASAFLFFLDIVCIKAHLHYHACVWFYNEFDMINGTESFAHFISFNVMTWACLYKG